MLNGGSADVEDGGALLQQVGKGAVHADDDQQPATGESASFNASNNQQQPYLEQQWNEQQLANRKLTFVGVSLLLR